MEKLILPGQQVSQILDPPIPPYKVIFLVPTPQGLGMSELEGLIYNPDRCRERVIEHALQSPDNMLIGMISSGSQATVLCDAKGWSLRLLRQMDDKRWLAALEGVEINTDTIAKIMEKVEELRRAAMPKGKEQKS